MDLAHLLGFVRMGDYVASLLKDALDDSGLNLTQAMVCWQLHEHSKPRTLKQEPLSLTELSRLLGASPARIHVQIKRLLADNLVQVARRPIESDRRVQRYFLSSKGRRQTQVFMTRASDACGVLWADVFSGEKEKPNFNAWSRINGRLLKALLAEQGPRLHRKMGTRESSWGNMFGA